MLTKRSCTHHEAGLRSLRVACGSRCRCRAMIPQSGRARSFGCRRHRIHRPKRYERCLQSALIYGTQGSCFAAWPPAISALQRLASGSRSGSQERCWGPCGEVWHRSDSRRSRKSRAGECAPRRAAVAILRGEGREGPVKNEKVFPNSGFPMICCNSHGTALPGLDKVGTRGGRAHARLLLLDKG